MIRPHEIDPAIQSALKERLAQIFMQNAALDPVTARVKSAGLKAWRDTAKRYATHYWGACALFASSLLGAPLIAPFNEGLWVMMMLGLNGLAIGLLVSAHRKVQGELTRYVNADVMRGASHLVALSAAEQRYCEAIAGLVDAGDTLGQAAQHEILTQLNELLASYRKLEAPLTHYRAASGSQSLPELEHELAGLTQQRDAQNDQTARATMEQSIALCRQRLEHARRIEPVREQATAQQQLILQTLASIQASLTRIAAADAAPLSADVAGLRESIHRVNQQTSSVEDAVNEVLSLSASG